MSNVLIRGNNSGHEKNSNGRGSIYPIKLKSGATRYRAAIHDINGKRRTKNFKKKAEAEDWLAMQRQSRNHGLNTYATNPKMTVGVYLLEWVESHKSLVKHSTYKSYKAVSRIRLTLGLASK